MFYSDDDEDMIVVNVDCHYTRANIGNTVFSLGDCVYIKVNDLYVNTSLIILLMDWEEKGTHFHQHFVSLLKHVEHQMTNVA